jgi:hypothetical protein
MQFKAQLNTLLNKEISRQDFIKYIGLGVVALSGAGAVLRLLSSDSGKRPYGGYDADAYGGSEDGR